MTRIFTTELVQVSGNFTFLEGPAWHPEGYLLVSDIPQSKIYRFHPTEGFSVWREESGHSNGLAFDREGCLIACEHGNRRVSRTLADGTIQSLADRYEGKQLNSPNDCAVRSDGAIYFTDPPYGIEPQQQELSFHGVYRVRPGEEPTLLVNDFDRPNGLAFTPDEQCLYIAETQKELIRIYSVTADGDLREGRIFVSVGRPDGMKVDQSGNLFVASMEGLVVFDSNGNRLDCLGMPERPANLVFGGREYQTLFIAARTGLYRIGVHHPGKPLW